jgi:hypothetical protein
MRGPGRPDQPVVIGRPARVCARGTADVNARERERLRGHQPKAFIKVDVNRSAARPGRPQPRGQNIIRPPPVSLLVRR